MKNWIDMFVFIIIIIIIGTGIYLYYQEYLPAIERYQSLIKENRILSEVIEDMKAKALKKKEIVKENDFMDKEKIKNILKTEDFDFTDTEEGIHITLSTDEIFKKNTTSFTETGKKMMKKLGIIISGMEGASVTIEGYTDNTSFSGKLKKKYPTSWHLSSLQAIAVAQYLKDSADIDPSLMKIVSYGGFHPAEDNDTAEGRKINRKIEVIIIPISPDMFEESVTDTIKAEQIDTLQ